MTFDDGILKIYTVENIAEPGMLPKNGLVHKEDYYFGFESIGYTRYYTALQVKSQISNLVHIWQDRSIQNEQICVLEDNLQYRIGLAQHVKNDEGLDITRLTLERLEEDYEYAEDLQN